MLNIFGWYERNNEIFEKSVKIWDIVKEGNKEKRKGKFENDVKLEKVVKKVKKNYDDEMKKKEILDEENMKEKRKMDGKG